MYFLNHSKAEESFQYHLQEMGMCQVSVDEENFPFKIVLMNPDTQAEPHAHIYGQGRNGKEIGAFYLTNNNPPRNVGELKPYAKGSHKGLKNVSLDWQEMIVKWTSKRSKIASAYSNWQFMQILFYTNAYAGKHNI